MQPVPDGAQGSLAIQRGIGHQRERSWRLVLPVLLEVASVATSPRRQERLGTGEQCEENSPQRAPAPEVSRVGKGTGLAPFWRHGMNLPSPVRADTASSEWARISQLLPAPPPSTPCCGLLGKSQPSLVLPCPAWLCHQSQLPSNSC